MSAARVIRFVIGLVMATVLLMVSLPFAGVPSSHFLPPGHVWGAAKGIAKGGLTGRFYDVTSNPFNVGGRIYFATYAFYAKAPLPGGAFGKPQVYKGTARIAKTDYDLIKITDAASRISYKARDMVPITTGQYVRVRYELTQPEINGPIAIQDPKSLSWPEWGGRNIDGASGDWSGWIGYVLLDLALGFGIMLILERFSARENI